MKVYALNGPSGTGKSTSALLFAHAEQIPAIIDDGILIYNGTKVAGSSAKYEENTITAIKRAVFYYEDHRKEVLNKLAELKPDKILLIGTSNKMVNKICKQLNLKKIDRLVDVTEIRSLSEIKMAEFIRRTKGEHVIPIPSIQIEHSLFKKLILKGTKVFSKQKKMIGETTIVRPTFQLGSIFISPEILRKIIAHRCQHTKAVDNYQHIKVTLNNHLPKAKLQVNLRIAENETIAYLLQQLQDDIRLDYLQYLNVELYEIDIHVAKIRYV